MRQFYVVSLTVGVAAAAIVGTNTPALSLTVERIAALSAAEQRPWKEYLSRSDRQREADRAVIRQELRDLNRAEATIPPNGRGVPRNRPDEWYGSDEARHIADIVVSFQTPAGGWSKNLNLTDQARKKGESFAANNLSRFPSAEDFDAPHDPQWNYVGTLDNDATNTELRFLAKVAAGASAEQGKAYRASFLKGVEYLLAAQYPNGGWPQVWPLEGGYHDAITINDGAMTETLETLESTASGAGEYSFVPEELRKRVRAAMDGGVECIVRAQIAVKGKRTAWAQQHDELTLRPVSARNYEPPAICSSESAGVLSFLMGIETPGRDVVNAVYAGAAWLRSVAISGKAYVREPDGAKLVDSPGAKVIWSRFYSIETGKPIFGDRDKSIHDDVAEISRERRNGYSWYNAAPEAALERFDEWAKKHPR